MGIAKKHRRRLVCHDDIYYWWVNPREDPGFPVLHICSEDKKTVLRYPLEQPAGKWYILSERCGKNKREPDGRWHRYSVPDMSERPGANLSGRASVTPGFVAELLGWFLEDEWAEEVAWDGQVYWL